MKDAIDIDIRPACLADAPHLSEMSGRLIEHGLPRSWQVPRVVRHMRRRDNVVIKAEIEDQVAGFAIMSFTDEAAHLNLLAVEPQFRRMAVGRRLLTWLEESAVCAGSFFVSLEVRVGNRGARRFYRALGYDETDLILGYYSGLEDAVAFARDLRVQPGDRIFVPER